MIGGQLLQGLQHIFNKNETFISFKAGSSMMARTAPLFKASAAN